MKWLCRAFAFPALRMMAFLEELGVHCGLLSPLLLGSCWPHISLLQLPKHASYDFPVNGPSNSHSSLPHNPPTPTHHLPPSSNPFSLTVPSHKCTRDWEPWPSVSLCNSLHGVSFSIKDFISIDLQRPHISSAAKTNQCHMSQINPSKDSKELMICSRLTL